MQKHSIQDLAVFGITLSGGGARGIAHIGVLDALLRFGIKPSIVSGTSMGAIVGVFYAAGFKPIEILEIVRSKKFLKMIYWHMPSGGLLDIGKVLKIMEEFIGEDDFSSLKIPFYCAVTNLNSGLAEIKSEGNLFRWVLASASIPVVFQPMMIGGQTYVDGGLLNNLPSDAIRNKCRFLIGVHVNHNKEEEGIKGLKTVAERCFRLAIAQNVTESKKLCDLLIEPPRTRDYNTFDFNKALEIYQVGFDETTRIIHQVIGSPEMQEMLHLN